MIGSVTLSPVSPVAPAREVPEASGPGSALPAASASYATISRSGELLNRFQQLAESDPSKAEAALERVSRDLRASAQRASGTQAETLNDLADRFARASGGDLSALNMSSAHHRHHMPTTEAVPAASMAGSSAGGPSVPWKRIAPEPGGPGDDGQRARAGRSGARDESATVRALVHALVGLGGHCSRPSPMRSGMSP